MDLKSGAKDYKKKYGARRREFATVAGTAARNARGRIEKATNDYQGSLLAAYDEWTKKTVKLLDKEERAGADERTLEGIVDDRILDLGKMLSDLGHDGITRASLLGLKGKPPSAAVMRATADQIEKNDRYIYDRLLPNIRDKLIMHIREQAKTYKLDTIALEAAFITQRSRTGGFAGAFWNTIFGSAKITQKEEDTERVKVGEKPRRVRWVLDPTVLHCEDSAGFYGCEELEGEYDSWDSLPTLPSGDVTCRGNCRCHIEVETDTGWDRVA